MVPLSFHDDADTAVIRPGEQSSAPDPGLTLIVRLASGDKTFSTRQLEVAMGVADTASSAKTVAAQLGADVAPESGG